MISGLLILAIVTLALLGHGYWYTKRAESRYPPTGQFARINGTRIHYLDLNPSAAGHPLVLIHGASCHLLDMKIALGGLAKDRRVILLDRPGFGYSGRPEYGHDLKVQADLIMQLLHDLKAERPIMVAQSFGTAVALALALNHQKQIAGLLLLAPVSHRWPGGVDWYNHAATSPVFGYFFRHALIPLYGHLTGRKAVASAFWPRSEPAGYFDDAAMPLIFRPATFKSNAEDIMGLYEQITGMEMEYQSLDMPVRMLSGTHDAVVLSTIHAMGLERKVENTSLVYVPEVGHPIHHFAPQEIENELAALESSIDESGTR